MALKKVNVGVMLVLEAPTKDSESWGVIVPHIPGCFSAGDTREGAMFNAREAIELHTELEPLTGDTSYLIDPTYVDMREYEGSENTIIITDVWVDSEQSDDPEHDKLMRKITHNIPRVAVGAIIVDQEGRILTCRRPHGPENYVGKLHTFGGKVDLGETLYDSIVREVREECNIDVTQQAWRMNMVGMIEEIEPECNYVVDGTEQMYHWVSAIWVFWLRDASFKNMEPHKHTDMQFREIEELKPHDLAPSAYHSLVLAGLFEPREDWHNALGDREAPIV